MKLFIKIKVNELQEIKPVIEEIKKLELGKSPELNPEIVIEFVYDDYIMRGNSDHAVSAACHALPSESH